jgi:hypothetical protein
MEAVRISETSQMFNHFDTTQFLLSPLNVSDDFLGIPTLGMQKLAVPILPVAC